MQNQDPLQLFELWLDEAKSCTSIREPTAMALATHSAAHGIANRIVLLKDFSLSGFTFYTNYDSAKGRDLIENASAAAVFFWDPLGKQVRIRGPVAKTTRQVSEHYWSTRPRESQLSQCVSRQSQPVADRKTLESLVEEAEKKFGAKSIPCPQNWGGFNLIPTELEFWQTRPGRLHDRFLFQRPAAAHPTNVHWGVQRLYP